jgi:hypothetical protein
MSSTHHRNGASRSCTSGTTLSKMIDAAATGKHNVKWSHVLHYLKAQCVISEDFDNDDSDEEKNRPFDLPFQRYYVASPELLQELSPSNTGQSVLRTAIAHGEVVPLSILQALCHLGPSAISHIDLSTGRMLLHTACRFPYPATARNIPSTPSPSSSIDAVLSLLVAAYPIALLHRDNSGCTPLHYLFMYNTVRLIYVAYSLNRFRTTNTSFLHCDSRHIAIRLCPIYLDRLKAINCPTTRRLFRIPFMVVFPCTTPS